MTDIDEEILIRDLHLRPLPAGRSDIGERSAALGRRMRRRRRSAAVAAFATLALVVGIGLSTGSQFLRLDPQPVGSPTAPGIPTLSAADLSPGPAPTLDYVHDGTWVRADGGRVTLADPSSLLTDRANPFVGFDGGLLAVRDLDPGPETLLGYSKNGDAPARVRVVVSRIVGGAQPGPAGTVLIPAVGGYAVAQPDGRWSLATNFGDPAAEGALPVAAVHDAVFHAAPAGSTTVARRSELDPSARVIDNDPWTRPVTSDITTDLLLLADSEGCQDVIEYGNQFSTTRSACTWDLRRLHPDAAHAVGYSADDGWGVVNLVTSDPVLLLGPREAIDTDSFQFDAAGQLNLVLHSDADQYAIATCTLEGRCWLAAPWSPSRYFLVQPNRK